MNGLALVGETRIAGDHEQPANARERSDDLLDHPVCEIVLIGVAAHIGERQDRYRRLVGQREYRSAFGRRRLERVLTGGEPHSVDSHRAGNVLEALLSNVVEREVKTPCYVLLYTGGHAYASGLGQTLQPSRDVHPVSKDVVVLNNDVALVNTDTKFDAIIVGYTGTPLAHRVLPLSRATQCIDYTGEFDQQAITGRFDYAAPIFVDPWLDNVRPDRP